MNDAALEPCPFCGARRTVELWDRFDAGHIAYLHCEGCGANGPSVYSESGAEAALVGARKGWNGRCAAPAASKEPQP